MVKAAKTTSMSLCGLSCAIKVHKTEPFPKCPEPGRGGRISCALLQQRRVPGMGSRAEEAAHGGQRRLLGKGESEIAFETEKVPPWQGQEAEGKCDLSQ